MITIKKTSAKGKKFINAYERANIKNLFEAYKNPSSAKCLAWEYCRKTCKQEKGKDIKIIGYMSNFFTVAWITKDGLRVETAQNTYIIK